MCVRLLHYFPSYRIVRFFPFDFPDVVWKFCFFFILFMFERFGVIVVTWFKLPTDQTYVSNGAWIWSYRGLLYNVFWKTFPAERASVLLSAITGFSICFVARCSHYFGVLGFYYLTHVFIQLELILTVCLLKILLNMLPLVKCLSISLRNLALYMFAVRWVVPNYLPWPTPFVLLCHFLISLAVFHFVVISGVWEGVLIYGGGSLKSLFIRR